MIRAAAVLVALALVAGLVLLLLLVLRGEDATVPRDRGEMTLTEFLRDSEIAAVPHGPGGPAATEPGAREEVPPPAGTEEPGPSATARAAGGRPERLVLRVGWVGTRPPEADPRRLEAALPPPPVPRHPQAPPLVREIHVAGARPLSLQVRAGPPWGEREFQPLEAGAETTFRLEDPHGGRGPRILRFLLDKEGASWVERFLQEGAGAAHFEIGAPGEITGRITDAAGKPLPGVAEADGVRAQADFNGDFTLQGVRAGVAVVRVHGPVANHAVTRCLLRAPGGPYTIALEPGFDLKLRLEGVAPLEESARPFWACLVPAGGSTAPETFAAETAYHRESRAGAFTFHRLPRSFRGVTVVFHPDHAARFVPIAGPADREVRVLLEPRALVTGLVRDAGTGQPVEAEVLVATSADET
ncbi:MAG: hypothetical protein JXQ29_05280, partial [Planctomycetes bacterium]|nr:hypothetical protein [Planctomycetota bacterium]